MKFFIREWSESTIVLMTETGNVLSYFTNVKDALNACEEWYSHNGRGLKQEVQVDCKQAVDRHSSALPRMPA